MRGHCHQVRSKGNLIMYNAVKDVDFEHTTEVRLNVFMRALAGPVARSPCGAAMTRI